MEEIQTLLARFQMSVLDRAKRSACGFITIGHALSAITCDFKEAHTICSNYKISLREFADYHLELKSSSDWTMLPSMSIDYATLIENLKKIDTDSITELDIFYNILIIIARHPKSELATMFEENVCELYVILNQVENLLNNTKRKINIIETVIEAPIGLSSTIQRIKDLSESGLGFLIEVHSKNQSGKSTLLNYLAQEFEKSSIETFHSVSAITENIRGAIASTKPKVLVIDDFDKKKNVSSLIKNEAFKKGTTIICSTTEALTSANFKNSTPENHIIINIGCYDPTDSQKIIAKLCPPSIAPQDIYDAALNSGYTELHQLIRITELSAKFHTKNHGGSGVEYINNAILCLYGTNTLNTQKLVDIFGTLDTRVKQQIFGQDVAIDRVCDAIKTNLLGFKTNCARPNGVFALVGGSGVGKTKTAITIADELGFDHLVLNMGEYHSPMHINKLIGAAAGYVGYDKGDGILHATISKNPKTVIILDEIEKADPKIADLFLSCFDTGTIITSSGKEILFNDAVFFLTSNAGISTDSLPVGLTKPKNAALSHFDISVFKEHFRTEFINRFTDIIEFKDLDEESLLLIAQSSISKIIANASAKLNLNFNVSSRVPKLILDLSDKNQQGARHIERIVESTVGGGISKFLINKKNNSADIKISIKSNKIFVS